MPSHPVDFTIQAHVFSTPELLAVFDEKARFQRWLDFEAALAFVQADLGLIPAEAAKEINAKARLDYLDLDMLKKDYEQSRNSLMPVIKGLRRACKNSLGEYVHYGATTQDVLDTSEILELQEVLNIIYRDMLRLEEILIDLSRRYRHTPMIGRTHGQQALPITFGLKSAVWLSEVRRHIERVKHLAPQVLVGQLSGAVGTMAALGPKAREVAAGTLARLGLGCPVVSWHTSRDNIAEVASFFAILTSTFEKIASEIIHLGKTEIGELAESAPLKAMSSSTMPHKKNPVICQRIAVLARHVRSLAGIAVEGMVHEHERDARSLWSEWLVMPQISIYTGTCIKYLNSVMADLEISTERMMGNLALQKKNVVSEWLLFKLGASMGKMVAHGKLYDLFQQVEATGKGLAEILKTDPDVGQLLNSADFEYLEHPEQYIGQAVELVDSVVSESLLRQQSDPEQLSR